MQYNQPLDQPSQPNASYIDGNPSAGIQGSIVPAASLEFDQREVVEVITRANARGYTDFSGAPCAAPANADLTQLRKAIEGFVQSFQLIIDSTITFRVHGTGADFSDLNAAMSYLRRYYITPRGYVILQCAGAQPGASRAVAYTYTTSIYFSHANNNRISVFGAPMLAAAPVSYTAYSLSGSSPTQRSADTANNLAMLRTKFATELTFTGPNGVIFGQSCPVPMHFDGFLLTGDGSSAAGLNLDASFGFMNLDTYAGIAIVGFGWGGVVLELGAVLGMEGPSQNETNLCPFIIIGCGDAAPGGGHGLIVSDGSYLTMSGNVLSFSNAGNGFMIWPRCGCQMDGAVHAACNGSNGVQTLLGPTTYIYGPLSGGTAYTRSIFWKNAQYGCWAQHSQVSAYCDCGAGTGNANGAGSIYAAYGSMVQPTAGDVGISATCTPAWGVVGNQNSLISP